MNNKIREYRKKYGLSQEELADKSDVSRSIISYLETGKQISVTSNTMKKISSVFNVKPSKIFLDF